MHLEGVKHGGLEAHAEHSFAFMTRPVLARLPIPKKIFFAFQLEAVGYKWLEG